MNGFRKYECGGKGGITRYFGKTVDGKMNLMQYDSMVKFESTIVTGNLKPGQTVSEDEQCWYDDYSQKYQFERGNVELNFECLEYLWMSWVIKTF